MILKPFLNFHTHKLDNTESEKGIFNLPIQNLKNIQIVDSQWFCIGIHPWYANINNWKEDIITIEKKLKYTNCIGVGECGLDKFVQLPLHQQLVIFEAQTKLAENYQKPIIIHCVKAHNELIAWRKKTKISVPLIVHGFNNNVQIATQLIKHGFYISLAGALLNRVSNAAKVLTTIDLDRLFLETDDSELGVEQIYVKASEILNVEVEALKNHIWENFYKIVQLK